MNKLYLFFLLIMLLTQNIIAQDKTYDMNEIVISGGRLPMSFSNLSRSVSVLSINEIQSIPVNNVIDLLKYIGGVDLRARGTEGVQADVSIRGGSFEETLIMIDGIKISDPQTGHNSLNLPISLDNIERIEVLKGEGGRIFGANAFSGAINIITKKVKHNSLSLSSLGGDNGLYEFGLSGSIVTGFVGNNLSVNRKKSDGYRDNTDFESVNYNLSQNYSFTDASINMLLGYTDKQFGANSFYSDLFPNQLERTLTKFGSISSDIKLGNVLLSPKIFFRSNFDDYHLDKFRADWNHNTHRTNSFGGEIDASFTSSVGVTSLGIEFKGDEINSTNLGMHNRNDGGIFIEHNFQPFKNISINAGFFAYNYSSIGWKFWPGLSASYLFNDAKLFASVGRAFRIPTYTELFYVSPSNMGNPNLNYEQTTNYEVGFSINKNNYFFSGSVFYKQGSDLIDWVRVDKNLTWQVQNVTELNTIGFETELRVFPTLFWESSPITNIAISYTYLSSTRIASGYESKYLLDHLKHQLVMNLSNELFLGINQTWTARFEQRLNMPSNFIVDTQVQKKIGEFNFFVRATNFFNETYYDLPGVLLPGRWISTGIKYSLNDF